MKCTCRVMFEYRLRKPDQWEGVIEGAAVHTVMHRAVATALKEIKPRRWSSVTATILDRDDLEGMYD